MRADRLLRILLLLQARGRLTCRELAGRLAISVRTVQRDLAALEAAGIPLTSTRGEGGGWAYVPGARITRLGAPDAAGWVEVEVDFESAPEARSYLLGLGGEVVVLGPAELREAVVAAAGRIVELNSAPANEAP